MCAMLAAASFTGMVPVLSPELWIPASASLDVEPVGICGSGLVDVVSEHGSWHELGGRADPFSGRPDAAYLRPKLEE